MLNLNDQNAARTSIEKILDFLKSKNYEQLWLNASIRLAKIYLDKKEYDSFQPVRKT
jgi:COP9 signalosome complex subunit 2